MITFYDVAMICICESKTFLLGFKDINKKLQTKNILVLDYLPHRIYISNIVLGFIGTSDKKDCY